MWWNVERGPGDDNCDGDDSVMILVVMMDDDSGGDDDDNVCACTGQGGLVWGMGYSWVEPM